MQIVACANWNFDGCLQLGYMPATNLYQHIYILHTLLVMYGCRAVPFLINHLRVQYETAHGIKYIWIVWSCHVPKFESNDKAIILLC